MKSFETKEEAIQYLNTLSMGQVIDLAAELLVSSAPTRKITISEEQFQKYFRIAGRTDSGAPETRGRKKKEA